jgi:hypothetical protein
MPSRCGAEKDIQVEESNQCLLLEIYQILFYWNVYHRAEYFVHLDGSNDFRVDLQYCLLEGT